jgi:hypothetical protein
MWGRHSSRPKDQPLSRAPPKCASRPRHVATSYFAEPLESRFLLSRITGTYLTFDPNIAVDPSDIDGDGISNAVEDGLLQRFYPRLTPNGYSEWHPVSITTFLERSDAWYGGTQGVPGSSYLIEADLSLGRALELVPRADFDHLLVTDNSQSGWGSVSQNLGLTGYGRVTSPIGFANGVYIVQYYFLLLWSRGRAGFGDHQGDWLTIDFTVDARDVSEPKIIEAIFHNHGRQLFVEPRALDFHEDTHPIVYLEANSNEPWPVPGEEGVRGWPALSVGTNRVFDGLFNNEGNDVRPHLGLFPDLWSPRVLNVGERTTREGSAGTAQPGVRREDDPDGYREAEFFLTYMGVWGTEPKSPSMNFKMWSRQFEYDNLNPNHAEFGFLYKRAWLPFHFDSDSDTVTIDATRADDVIIVTSRGGYPSVSVGGMMSFLPATTTLIVNGVDGNDTIYVDSTDGPLAAAQLVVNGGAGDDVVYITALTENMDDLDGVVRVAPGSGSDQVIAWDRKSSTPAGAAPVSYAIVSELIDRTNTPYVYFPSDDRVTLYAGSGDNSITIYGTPRDAAVLVDAGGGDDTVYLGGRERGNLDAVTGPVTVHGGAGANTLSIRDQANGTPGDVYYIEGRAFGRTRFEPGGLPGLAFKDVYQVELLAGTGNNTIHVRSLPDAIRLSVDAGGGGDTVHVGRPPLDDVPQGDLDEITGSVDVRNAQRLHIHDAASADPADVYRLRGLSFERTRFEPAGRGLTFGPTLTDLRLYAGTGDNSIQVHAVPNGIPLQVHAGGGTDTVDVGSPPENGENQGDLDQITGTVFVGGAENLRVNDDASAEPSDVYLVDGRAFDRTRFEAGLPVPRGLTFDGAVSNLTLSAGTGNNTIHVRAIPSGIRLTVEAGGGDDTVHLGRASEDGVPLGNLDEITGTVSVEGGPGNNTLSIHDPINPSPDLHVFSGHSYSRDRFAGVTYADVHRLRLAAGTGGNRFNVNSLPVGTVLELDAGRGDDTVYVAPDTGGNLDAIAGPIEIWGGGGTDTLSLNDTLDSSGDTVTVTDAAIGAAPGDTLFRPGGGVIYHEIYDLILKLGGGPDAVSVTPIVGTRIELRGGGPPPLAPSGDRLELVPAGAAGLVFARGAPGDGVYTFSNRSPVAFFGFENAQTAPPRVTGASVGSSGWSPAFNRYLGGILPGYAIPAGSAQVDELPWANLNRISLSFNEDVAVDAAALRVGGVTLGSYPLDPAAFSYDSAARTATWRLAPGLMFGKDRILINLDSEGVRNSAGFVLDGDWANPVGSAAGGDTFPSGDGTPGGNFALRINVLPGDVNRSGAVLADDFSEVKRKFFRSTADPGTGDAAYSALHDIDGSGEIIADDFSGVKRRFFDRLPYPELVTGAAGIFPGPGVSIAPMNAALPPRHGVLHVAPGNPLA